MKIKKSLEENDKKVGGLLTPEIREGRSRKGFKIINILNGEEGILAHINQKEGPNISKYRVNLEDLNRIGIDAINEAIKKCDIIIIDEIGKMELFSESFKDGVDRALNSNKIVLATMGRISHPFVKKIQSREDIEKIILTVENRSQKFEELKSIIFNLTKK